MHMHGAAEQNIQFPHGFECSTFECSAGCTQVNKMGLMTYGSLVIGCGSSYMPVGIPKEDASSIMEVHVSAPCLL